MKEAVSPRKEIALIHPALETDLRRECDEVIDAVQHRAYALFEERGGNHGADLEDWLRAEREMLQPVPVDLFRNENKLVFVAEVPGFTVNEVRVNLEPQAVTISAVKDGASSEKPNGAILLQERAPRRIFRTFVLPFVVLPDKGTATLRDGLLEVVVPIAAQAGHLDVKAA
jgi:HSP20 family protein